MVTITKDRIAQERRPGGIIHTQRFIFMARK